MGLEGTSYSKSIYDSHSGNHYSIPENSAGSYEQKVYALFVQMSEDLFTDLPSLYQNDFPGRVSSEDINNDIAGARAQLHAIFQANYPLVVGPLVEGSHYDDSMALVHSRKFQDIVFSRETKMYNEYVYPAFQRGEDISLSALRQRFNSEVDLSGNSKLMLDSLLLRQ